MVSSRLLHVFSDAWLSADRLSMSGARPPPDRRRAACALQPATAIIAPASGGFMLQLQSAFGVFALLALAWAFGENRRAVSLRQAGIGLAVTLVTAVALIKLPFVAHAFGVINDAIGAISAASRAGTAFVFGYLGGGALPFDLKAPGADFILAFQALPVVLVMSVLTTLLFYWRILPPVVRGMAWLLERTLGVGGAVGLSTAANIFLGMVEAPLFIRPYLSQLTRSELFLVMTGGMAGIAGTVLVLYATLLAPLIPDAAAHFVIASVLGAPAAILVSLIMVPETEGKPTGGAPGDPRVALADPRVALADPRVAFADPDIHAASTMDAIVKGTVAGLDLLLNIVAMLIVLVALVYLANAILGLLPNVGGAGISLQRLLGYAMAPVCWLIGLPWPQAITAGSLMGVKTVLNELIAYVDLSKLGPEALDPRSRLIMLYAMCGFANFGSLGIMIGGLGTMAPDRRNEINSLGLKSIVSGTLTTCLMGAIVGVLT
jgi:concentrative nucleoside transporter, CNT family